jgi:hypothetical protein
MLATRTSLLTLAAVATLAVAGSTAAEARYFGSSFCHRGPASFFKPYVASSMQRKAASVRQRDRDDDDEPQEKYRAAAKSAKPAVVASAPKPAATPVKPATVAAPVKPASDPAPVKPVSLASAAATTPATAGTTTCLTKEYLETGAVKFRDICTNEWAINSTDVVKKMSSFAPNCLTKDSNQSGIVMFKDTCTNEWAMNTSDQQTAQVR